MTMTRINNALNKIRNFFLWLFVCYPVLIWIDFVSTFCNNVGTSFLIKFYLFTSTCNMSDSETNLLIKFELRKSHDLVFLRYLPFVGGDNSFICRSSTR
jgi:hypothetical protein